MKKSIPLLHDDVSKDRHVWLKQPPYRGGAPARLTRLPSPSKEECVKASTVHVLPCESASPPLQGDHQAGKHAFVESQLSKKCSLVAFGLG